MPKLKKGQKPRWASEETDFVILRCLEQSRDHGGLRFTELFRNTKRSRDTLTRHLKDLFKKNMINYNYLTKRYSITRLGLETLQKQEELTFLGSSQLNVKADAFTELSSKDFTKIAEGLAKALEHTMRKGFISTIGGVMDVPKDCISFSIYSGSKRKGSAVKNARRLAEMAKSAMLITMATLNKCELRKVSDIAIVFRFNKDKIDKYLTSVSAVTRKGCGRVNS